VAHLFLPLRYKAEAYFLLLPGYNGYEQAKLPGQSIEVMQYIKKEALLLYTIKGQKFVVGVPTNRETPECGACRSESLYRRLAEPGCRQAQTV